MGCNAAGLAPSLRVKLDDEIGASGVEVEEVLGRCWRCGEPLGRSDPENPHHRWSGGDGHFLSRICPRCRQSYDPDRPETFEPAGKRVRRLEPLPRAAVIGAVAAGWTLGGRVLISMLLDPGDAATVGGSVLVVMGAVYGFLPWLFVAAFLWLLALQDRLEPLPAKLLAGAVLGPLVCVGLPPATLLAGVVLGPLAGLVLRSRKLAGAA